MVGGSGLFVAFEGVEGSGKSTHIRRVADRLLGLGVDPLVTREPGGTAAAEAIRAIVLDERYALNAVAELLLMLAARSVFVREVVQPALSAGRLVLSDRYELSTFAYQGGGRGLPLDRVREMNRMATGGLRPDLSVLLDVDPEQGRVRRGDARDRIEGEDPAFHERVAEAYRRLAAEEANVAVVDARGEIEETHAAVWEVLAVRFPETFSAG